jgi:hypothetical protein
MKEMLAKMKTKIDANQERTKESQREEIKSDQAEMRLTASANEYETKAEIHSIRTQF